MKSSFRKILCYFVTPPRAHARARAHTYTLIFRHFDFATVIQVKPLVCVLLSMALTCGLGCEADFRKSTRVSPLPDVRLNHERKFYNSQTLPSCFSCGILSFLKLSSTGIPETGKLHLFHPLLLRLRRSQGSGLRHSSRCPAGQVRPASPLLATGGSAAASHRCTCLSVASGPSVALRVLK